MKKLIRSQTRTRLKKLEAASRHVTHSKHDVDAIHDLRVTIRRLKQELAVFEPWFGSKTVKKVRRPLRKLMDGCAAVRNCDIAIEILRVTECENPALVAALDQERRRMSRKLFRDLASWRRKGRVDQWREHLRSHADSDESAESYARRLLPAMIDDLFRAGRVAVEPGARYVRMHRLRLEAKRVRYSVDLFEKVYGKSTEPMLESLKGLQEKLGALNDCATTIEMISRDRAAAAGVRRLAGQRETEFRAYWKTHFGSRAKVQWKAVLRAADGKK